MTVKEVLESTICTLSAINIPVALIKQIGEPVANAIGNLTACVDAIGKEDAKNGHDADAG